MNDWEDAGPLKIPSVDTLQSIPTPSHCPTRTQSCRRERLCKAHKLLLSFYKEMLISISHELMSQMVTATLVQENSGYIMPGGNSHITALNCHIKTEICGI